jgi:hypothetical protein
MRSKTTKLPPEDQFDLIKQRDWPNDTYKTYGVAIFKAWVDRRNQARYWHRVCWVLMGAICLLLIWKR